MLRQANRWMSFSGFLALGLIAMLGRPSSAEAESGQPSVVKNPYAAVNWDPVKNFKANLHAHTISSDGRAEPEELVQVYAEAGYHIPGITDHDNYHTMGHALKNGHTFVGSRTDVLPVFRRVTVDDAAKTISVQIDNHDGITWIQDGEPVHPGDSIEFSEMKDALLRFRVQAWETTIAAFEELDRNTTYPDDAILFAGSSSIRLWTNLADDMAPYPVIQRGYGGARCCDFAVYADRILHPHRPRAIVLFIANDIAGRDGDKTPDEVLKLFRYIVERIRITGPETPVFWIAITPTESRWQVWPKIQELNQKIRDHCAQHPHLHYIATEDQFLNDQKRPRADLFQDDRLHLNDAGYQVWTRIIRRELDRVFSAP